MILQNTLAMDDNGNKIKMFTPRTKKSNIQATQHSSNLSNRNTTDIREGFNNSGLVNAGSNKQMEKIKPVAKLSINIRRKNVSSPDKVQNSPQIRVNPLKYRPNIISKMSSQQHGKIYSYGISTYKGAKNILNPHFISLNLGNLNSLTLSEAIDGQSAAKIVKQEFRTQLTDLTADKNSNLEFDTIKEVFRRVQHKLMNYQQQTMDNSGSTLIALVVDTQFVVVANAGSSHVACMTKNGNFLKLSQSHTTTNQKQINRVIKNGGRIYQTVVNVPYQQELELQGPMRISPSGLVYTRCLGKTSDFKNQLRNLDHLRANPEEQLNITWKPQIRYLKTDEVSWIGIFSDSIIKNCSYEYIQQCVKAQSTKKSMYYSEHQIAMEISKKIIDKLTKEGVPDAMSAIIVFLSPIEEVIRTPHIENFSAKKARQGQMNEPLHRKDNSLHYLGNRRSFVKSVESVQKSVSSTKKKKSTDRSRNELHRDFSFSQIH